MTCPSSVPYVLDASLSFQCWLLWPSYTFPNDLKFSWYGFISRAKQAWASLNFSFTSLWVIWRQGWTPEVPNNVYHNPCNWGARTDLRHLYWKPLYKWKSLHCPRKNDLMHPVASDLFQMCRDSMMCSYSQMIIPLKTNIIFRFPFSHLCSKISVRQEKIQSWCLTTLFLHGYDSQCPVRVGDNKLVIISNYY